MYVILHPNIWQRANIFHPRAYEDIKKSDRINSAGCACYVERNYWMIDDSKFSIFYYPKSPSKSGTYLAYQYAETKNEGCINLKG